MTITHAKGSSESIHGVGTAVSDPAAMTSSNLPDGSLPLTGHENLTTIQSYLLAEEQRHDGASGFCAACVLGLLDCSKKHAEDFEEDQVVTAVEQLDDFSTRFCTPIGRVPHAEHHSHWRAMRR